MQSGQVCPRQITARFLKFCSDILQLGWLFAGHAKKIFVGQVSSKTDYKFPRFVRFFGIWPYFHGMGHNFSIPIARYFSFS